jgi:hypothetical protein
MLGFHRLTPEHRIRVAAVLAVITTLVVCATLVLGVSTFVRLQTQVERVSELAHSTTQQTVKARYDDCLAGDVVRRELYRQAFVSDRSTALLLRLVPSLDTDEVRDLAAERRARQLRAFLPRGAAGCSEYALSVVPPHERSSYRVP